MEKESRKDKQTGQILLEEGIIDVVQLHRALSEQARQATYKPLGEILRDLGLISRRKLQDTLLKHKKQIPLGELLVKMGLISDLQLSHALEDQKGRRKKVGQILVERGFIEKRCVMDALCLQLGIQGMDLSPLADKEILRGVNLSFLHVRRVLPLSYDRKRRVIRVLMEDPTDVETISDLEKVFKAEVEPIMLRTGASAQLFEGLLDIWYLSP